MGALPYIRVQILSHGKRALGLALEALSPQLIAVPHRNSKHEFIPAALPLKILSRGICQLCLLFQLLQVALPNCLLTKSLVRVIRVGPSHQHVARLHSHIAESGQNSQYLWMPLLIKEHVLILCYSHFADGGIML